MKISFISNVPGNCSVYCKISNIIKDTNNVEIQKKFNLLFQIINKEEVAENAHKPSGRKFRIKI